MTAEAPRHDDFPSSGGHTRGIIGAAIGALVLLGGAIGVLFAVFRWQVPNQEPRAPSVFPSPRLLQNEGHELHQLRSAHQKQLESYGWVDRDKKLVAIPIERAMEIIAKRGSDAYKPIDQSAGGTKGEENTSARQMQSPPQKSSAPAPQSGSINEHQDRGRPGLQQPSGAASETSHSTGSEAKP